MNDSPMLESPPRRAQGETAEHWGESANSGHVRNGGQLTRRDQDSVKEYRRLTAAELDSGKFDLAYLIEDVMVDKQPQIGAGPKKALKTTIYMDGAISFATGKPFLERFKVNRSGRVAFMSGESGLATLQETARRSRTPKLNQPKRRSPMLSAALTGTATQNAGFVSDRAFKVPHSTPLWRASS